MTLLGERIRLARTMNGWTQQRLAEQLHVHQSLVSCYERGKVEPSIRMLLAIAQVTNFSLEFFISQAKITIEVNR